MLITIDPHSGFCFGVVRAVEVAERELQKNHTLYCLGDIVHNNKEVERLKALGLVIISYDEFRELRDCTVMIRAHGEPPETYAIAKKNRNELIDASCPIVLNLQKSIQRGYREMLAGNGQVVIYGKEGHAEVNGLSGQTGGTAIVIGDEADLGKIDFTRPVRLYSQTTRSLEKFHRIAAMIREKMHGASPGGQVDFEWFDTVCRQVSNRSAQLQKFAAGFDVVIFVSGLKSSNGKVLYGICKAVNSRSHFVSGPATIENEWFARAETVGICGATSTPRWLMDEVARAIAAINR